jgi:poly(3-hydroxybutyrate) depolymerase
MRIGLIPSLLTLPVVLACAGVGAEPLPAPGPTPAPRAAPRPAPGADTPPPPPRAAPARGDIEPLPTAERCVDKGVYEVRHEGDRVPSVLVVEGKPGPRTLVVALHGGSGDARKILSQTRWHSKAKVEGAVAVLAPHAAEMAGHGPHWNTGKFDTVVGPDAGRDDIAYLDGLVARVKKATCAERVLGVGFSNGGQMVHRWACQGRSLDAVISSAGTLLVDPSTCRGPVPLRSYVGDEDRVYDSSPLEGAGQPPVPESAALWAEINGCSLDAPEVQRDAVRTCTRWTGCTAPTELCVIHGMPHAWPAPWAGKKASRVDATTEGWAWFEGLPR